LYREGALGAKIKERAADLSLLEKGLRVLFQVLQKVELGQGGREEPLQRGAGDRKKRGRRHGLHWFFSLVSGKEKLLLFIR